MLHITEARSNNNSNMHLCPTATCPPLNRLACMSHRRNWHVFIGGVLASQRHTGCRLACLLFPALTHAARYLTRSMPDEGLLPHMHRPSVNVRAVASPLEW